MVRENILKMMLNLEDDEEEYEIAEEKNVDNELSRLIVKNLEGKVKGRVMNLNKTK